MVFEQWQHPSKEFLHFFRLKLTKYMLLHFFFHSEKETFVYLEADEQSKQEITHRKRVTGCQQGAQPPCTCSVTWAKLYQNRFYYHLLWINFVYMQMMVTLLLVWCFWLCGCWKFDVAVILKLDIVSFKQGLGIWFIFPQLNGWPSHECYLGETFPSAVLKDLRQD